VNKVEQLAFLERTAVKDLRPVYLWYGEETFLIRQARELLKQKVLPPGLLDFNLDLVDGKKASPAKIVELCLNLPVMAPKRLVFVEEAPWFGRKARGGETEAKEAPKDGEVQALLDYLDDPNPECVLVFVAGSAVDQRLKLVKKIKATGQVVEFKPLKGMEINRWAENILASRGLKASRSALDYLGALVGSDLGALTSEIDKIATYLEPGQELTPEVVLKLVPKTAETVIFDVADALAGKDVSTALELARDMLASGEPPVRLAFMIARQYRLMIAAKSLGEPGMKRQVLAERMGVHPFVAEKALMQSKKYSFEELLKALEILLNLDASLKSGPDPVKALELSFLELGALERNCRPARRN